MSVCHGAEKDPRLNGELTKSETPGHAIMTVTFHFTCLAQLRDGGIFASHLMSHNDWRK